jgi:hypothetical protein
MNKEEYISIHEFCTYYHAENSFVHSLSEFGLIESIKEENTIYLHKNQLPELEKYMRLHYEMDINIEGIDAISHLLQKINSMQDELVQLINRLNIY